MHEACLVAVVRHGRRLLYSACLALGVVGRRRFVRMVRLAMAPTVDFPLERPAADVAREGLVAGVFPRVRDQVRRLTERLPTHCAFVRLLS